MFPNRYGFFKNTKNTPTDEALTHPIAGAGSGKSAVKAP